MYLAAEPPVATNMTAYLNGPAVTINPLAEDYNRAGDALTVTSVGTPNHGTATVNADSTITYTPTSGTTVATDAFTYTLSNGDGGTSTATAYVYLADQPPVATDATAYVQSSAVTLDVLADDYSPAGDTLTVTTVGTAAHGTVALNADNTITYTPTSGTTAATDSFTYTISDGDGGTSTATVYLYLTDHPPVATDVTAYPNGSAVTINVLADDYSPAGNTLTVTSVSTASHGTATINADNTITYTPTTGTTAAADAFTYTLSDGDGGTSTATVYVELADRPPVAEDSTAYAQGSAVTIDVLAGDYSPDGDNLTVTSVGTAAHGTTVLNADNSVTYTPTSGTTAATDSFTYSLSDGNGGTSTGTVYVYLSDQPPVAVDTSVSTHSTAVTIDVLTTDTSPAGDALTVTSVGTPAHGSAVVNADNTITYTPTSGTTAATDSFTYSISDGYGGTSTGTVYVYLADQPPTALDASISTQTAAVTVDVLANDSSPSDAVLTVTSVGTPSRHGDHQRGQHDHLHANVGHHGGDG